jgi:hypothetical protein
MTSVQTALRACGMLLTVGMVADHRWTCSPTIGGGRFAAEQASDAANDVHRSRGARSS